MKLFRAFFLSFGGGLIALMGGYGILLLMLTEPAEVQVGPLDPAMLVAAPRTTLGPINIPTI